MFARTSWILLLLVSTFCYADTGAEATIAHTIIMQWDSPDAPVTVGPIVVVNDHAIAGWTKGQRGGRALLRSENGVWQVYMCGGDDLTKSSYLAQAGMSHEDATQLAQAIKNAELGLSANQQKQLSSFEGVMPVAPQEHHHHE